MATPDYATWLTKPQAADALKVSLKTIEQWAKEKRLDQGRYKRPEGGPALAVYNPDDVARLAAERQPEAAPFVLPAVRTPSNGNGVQTSAGTALAIANRGAAGPDAARAFLEAMLTSILSQSSPTSESSQKSAETLWVTVAEAAAILGLPQVDVRVLVLAGDLPHRRTGRGGIRIRRRDLEAL